MTHYITTGPHSGQPGACMAQYNHHTLSHTPHHNSSNHNPHHMNPYMQQPFSGQAAYVNPSWRPPMATFPYLY